MAVLTLLKGYPDRIGKRFAFVGYANGPKSYIQGGDPATLPGFQNYIDFIDGGVLSVSGTYYVISRPLAFGPRATWNIVWTVTATDAEVGAGVDLSAETIQLGGFGGVY